MILESGICPMNTGIESSENYQVYIAYLDDSCEENKFQVIGAVIVPDGAISQIENDAAALVEDLVPEDLRKDFEPHASRILSGARPPYDKLKPSVRHEIILRTLQIASSHKLVITYGATDIKALGRAPFRSADSVQMAFMFCAKNIESWLSQQSPDALGLLIADEGKKQKHAIQSAFYSMRRRMTARGHNRGELPHVHDDMYFGESHASIGIQLADACCLAILRHLCGRTDDATREYFQIIKHLLYKGKVYPKLRRLIGKRVVSLRRKSKQSTVIELVVPK